MTTDSQPDDLNEVNKKRPIPGDEEGSGTILREPCETAIELIRSANL